MVYQLFHRHPFAPVVPNLFVTIPPLQDLRKQIPPLQNRPTVYRLCALGNGRYMYVHVQVCRLGILIGDWGSESHGRDSGGMRRVLQKNFHIATRNSHNFHRIYSTQLPSHSLLNVHFEQSYTTWSWHADKWSEMVTRRNKNILILVMVWLPPNYPPTYLPDYLPVISCYSKS